MEIELGTTIFYNIADWEPGVVQVFIYRRPEKGLIWH